MDEMEIDLSLARCDSDDEHIPNFLPWNRPPNSDPNFVTVVATHKGNCSSQDSELRTLSTSSVAYVPRWVLLQSPVLLRVIENGEASRWFRYVEGWLSVLFEEKAANITLAAFFETLQFIASPAPWNHDVDMLFSIYCCAEFLDLQDLSSKCRAELGQEVHIGSVGIAAWMAQQYRDEDLLRRTYWFLKRVLCMREYPDSWTNESSDGVRLLGGALRYRQLEVPLTMYRHFVTQDRNCKEEFRDRLHDGYLLYTMRRVREENGAFPHIYEVRLDNTNQVLLSAVKLHESGPVMFFKGYQGDGESQYCDNYIGVVEPNFWGTHFTLYDSGVSPPVDSLAKDLPLYERSAVLSITFNTNLLGDQPRVMNISMERDGVKSEFQNVKPKWNEKIQAHALPFFGRAKLPSSKNFQLRNSQCEDDIYLTFGKMSEDEFCLDCRPPLNIRDALAVAVASLAKKRAVA